MTDSMSVGLVLGAGGTTGSAFIRAALAELQEHTGFRAEVASTIIGTSAGAFTSSALDDMPAGVSADTIDALGQLTNAGAWSSRLADPLAAGARRLGGRLVARLSPTNRPSPGWDVRPAPHHRAARIITARKPWGSRVAHHLAGHADPTAVVLASAAIPFVTPAVRLGDGTHVDGAVWSPTNADLVSVQDHDALVVIAAMVPASGGSFFGRLHRVLLRRELRAWVASGKPVVVVAPTGAERANRKERDEFASAGTAAVIRLLAGAR